MKSGSTGIYGRQETEQRDFVSEYYKRRDVSDDTGNGEDAAKCK